jgi:hypothetical protein
LHHGGVGEEVLSSEEEDMLRVSGEVPNFKFQVPGLKKCYGMRVAGSLRYSGIVS